MTTKQWKIFLGTLCAIIFISIVAGMYMRVDPIPLIGSFLVLLIGIKAYLDE